MYQCKHIFSLTHSFSYKHLTINAFILFMVLCGIPSSLLAQNTRPGAFMPGTYGLKIFQINPGLYPFVQVYFRTFGEQQRPLINLNERNIGLMVKGYAYDPAKTQYFIQTIYQRDEAIRSVIVLDASGSMSAAPFLAAKEATSRYIDSKRPQDEIAVLAIRDTTEEGYEVVSPFERDPSSLRRRVDDIKLIEKPKTTPKKTRLYDSIAYAMLMCGMASQGAVRPSPKNYIFSCAVVVFSDGHDQGSALSREELNARITNLSTPIPVYSVAYAKKEEINYFKNLEAISKNSFGIYYQVGDTLTYMTKILEEIQYIMNNDYVVTFRSYICADGEEHIFKLGVEYPAGSGKYFYETGRFEAIQPPIPLMKIKEVDDLKNNLKAKIPFDKDKDPYYIEDIKDKCISLKCNEKLECCQIIPLMQFEKVDKGCDLSSGSKSR